MENLARQVKYTWFPPTDPKDSFQGRTILITGANTGLGLEAAKKFVALHAKKVILTSRSPEKGAAAKSLLESLAITSSLHPATSIEAWDLEMDSYDSIRRVAHKASEQEHLDVAILNAGLAPRDFQRGPYGWERALQVNALSTALLGLLLLPILRKSARAGVAKPKLEIVAARVHQAVVVEEGVLPLGGGGSTDGNGEGEGSVLALWNYEGLESGESQREWAGHRQYARSKLLVVVAMMELAEMAEGMEGPDVVVDAVCPGGCKSELTRDFENIVAKVIKAVAGKVLLKTAEEGARTYILGVSGRDELHGRFISHADIRETTPVLSGADGERLRKKIWREMVEALRKDVPEVTEFVRKP